MGNIKREELEKIPYFDVANIGSRIVPTLMFHTKEKGWQYWHPTPDGLFEMHPKDFSKGLYFAAHAVKENDLYMDFINTIAQRIFWKEVAKPFEGIHNSVHKIATSVAKFLVYFEWSKSQHPKFEATSFVETELEYLLILCRSMFDLLQEAFSRIWINFRFFDSTLKKQIPDTFSKIALHDNKPRNAGAISKKWNIPLVLSEFYERQTTFFEQLRGMRDNIVHHGASVDFIFKTKRGFAMPASTKPFDEMGV